MAPLELAGLLTAVTGAVTIISRGLTYLWHQRTAREAKAEALKEAEAKRARAKTAEIDTLKWRLAKTEVDLEQEKSTSSYLRQYLEDCQAQLTMRTKR